jgi:DNA-binding beta-propeller fold protein YncE
MIYNLVMMCGSGFVPTPPEPPEWNVAAASYVASGLVDRDVTSTGLFFKPDGTEIYICGYDQDFISRYTLSTAWDITTVSFTSVKDISVYDTQPMAIFIKSDGTSVYVTGNEGNDINQFTMTTPWDVTTLTFVQVKSVSAQTTQPRGVFFKPDGLKMYVTETAGEVFEYSLSTAWDISTATYTQFFDASVPDSGQVWASRGIFFRDDGTRMFVHGNESTSGTGLGTGTKQFQLSTPWDISTATYTKFKYTGDLGGSQYGPVFKTDGLKMYNIEFTDQVVNQFDLS